MLGRSPHSQVRRGSPDPAVRWGPTASQVARSRDLATTATRAELPPPEIEKLFLACSEAEPGSSTSDLQEQLPPVHPEEDQPEDQEDGGALDERGVGGAERFEEVAAQVGLQVVGNEVVCQVGQDVG